MPDIALVIFFAAIGGIVSLIGGMILLSRKSWANTITLYATPFAAGALLSAAFLDLLKEGGELGDYGRVLLWALFGVLGFFILENFLDWFHHHHEHVKDTSKKVDPNTSLVIIGDTIHNFIDGIAIAAAFLINVPTGIVATIAVAAHEIPQEIGDFGILLKKGMSKNAILLVNLFSAMATVVAAAVFYTIGDSKDFPLEILLGLTAGFFIYIAASDLIPSIHDSKKTGSLVNIQTIMLVIGALTVGLLTNYLHGIIDNGHDHSEETHSHEEAEHSAHDHEEGDSTTHEHSGVYEYTNHETLPELTFVLEKDIKSGWNLIINTNNFEFSPQNAGLEHVDNQGHAHLYINGQKTRVYSNYYHIADLKDGDDIIVSLNTNDHRNYTHDGQSIEAHATIDDSKDSINSQPFEQLPHN